MEIEKKPFTTTADEIMEVGAKIIAYEILKDPKKVLISDELSTVVAHLAAVLLKRKED